MTEFDLSFPHHFELAELPELPGSGFGTEPVHFYPRTKMRPEHDGIWLRLIPKTGSSWVGVFDFGYGIPPAISRVLSTPNPEKLCVVSAGAAYLVQADAPERWERLNIFPVTDIRVIVEREFVVFATFHKLVALGGAGLAWESDLLCSDDLRIKRADAEFIEGTGYDPAYDPHEGLFRVDTRTGKMVGSPNSEGHPSRSSHNWMRRAAKRTTE